MTQVTVMPRILFISEVALLIYLGRYTTHPSSRYAPRTRPCQADDGESVKGDDKHAVARLIGNRTYEYAPGVSMQSAKGPKRFGGQHFNVLKKTVSSSVERFKKVHLSNFIEAGQR